MKGSLEPVNPKFITPKKTSPGQSSPEYSPAYPVDVSPIKDVNAAAVATSMQERFEKNMSVASRKGKGRRTTTQRRGKKTTRRRKTMRRK